MDVPQGVSSLGIALDLILAPAAIGPDSSASATQQLMVLNQLNYQASLVFPAGWRYGTALPVERESGGTVEFKTSSLTTLVDAPLLAGKYFQTFDLTPGGPVPHFLHLAADGALAIEVAPEFLASWRSLVKEETALFGLAPPSQLSLPVYSERPHAAFRRPRERRIERQPPGRQGFEDDGTRRYTGDLLPHEMGNSRNGKYRRRSGLRKPEDFREELAQFAAFFSYEAGRGWRAPKIPRSPCRTHYYNQSTLIWLEADVLIRQLSHGTKSLDDFCKAFAAGMPSLKPYGFDEVVSTLGHVPDKPYPPNRH